jgi:hypothetical protein
MAQDFHLQFPYSPNNKMINEGDFDGIKIAALQAICDKLPKVLFNTITLNDKGEGIVQLSCSMNDPQYSLTSIGIAAPNLHIAKPIDSDGSFIIAGGPPYSKVSWCVSNK